MFKAIAVSILLFVLTGCASVSQQYASFDDYVANKKNVDVVIDSVFLSHLKGPYLGFNQERNELILAQIKEAVRKSLVANGFEATFRHLNHGLSFLPDEKYQYVFSRDWQSIGRALVLPLQGEGDSGWAQKSTNIYLTDLLQRAEQESALRKKDRVRRDVDLSETNTDADSILPLLKTLPSGMMLYVQVRGELRPLSSKVARNAAALVISGVLTGGTLFATSINDSYTVNLAAVDTNSGQVVWHDRRVRQGFKGVGREIEIAFTHYPLIDGRYLTGSERDERTRERRRSSAKVARAAKSSAR